MLSKRLLHQSNKTQFFALMSNGISATRFCASSSAAAAPEQNKQDTTSKTTTTTTNSTTAATQNSFFVPVRSLLRLGENADLVRRALRTQSEDQLVKTAKKFFAIHKQKLANLKDLSKTKRYNVPKLLLLKIKLRSVRAGLYWERCKIRGYGALSDLMVILVLLSFAAFSYSVFQALYIWMKRQQQLEMMTAHITHTVDMLEAHGRDGEKLIEDKKMRGEALPMPEQEKDWHLYSNKK